MKKFSWFILAIISLIVLPTIAVTPAYEIIDLGTMGGDYSKAEAVNDHGQVVGEGFYYDGTTFHQSGYLFQGYYAEVASLNNHGQLTGAVTEYKNGQWQPYQAFLHNGNKVTKLGTLGGTTSGGIAVNDSGQVAGNSDTAGNAASHAFYYDGTTMHDIGTFGGENSTAWDINNNGQVVGRARTSYSTSRAFLYDDTGIHDLGTLGGNHSDAYSINDLGQVTGDSYNSNSNRHAFYYDGLIMHDLGSLKGENGYSSGWGINNKGQIVGNSAIPDVINVTHAFIYEPATGMLDLNHLIPPDSGWVLNSALDINESGQIVGGGLFNGQQHAFLLTPVPEPATLSLLALGGLLLRKRK
ncbi:MAG: DUF3466 family protein [Planctomycetota bacterium]|jgi:probable HAF family extracellular repeat protein